MGSIKGVNNALSSTKIGIGTTAPMETLDVEGGNILIGSPGQGIILTSPDGRTRMILTIDNSGALSIKRMTRDKKKNI